MRNHTSSLSFLEKSQPPSPDGSGAPSPRSEFLAAHPKARELQESQIAEINRRISRYRDSISAFTAAVVDKANDAREIGIIVSEFIDTFPGKDLTEDFWRQVSALFVDEHGQHITKENLICFARVAKRRTEPFTNPLEVSDWLQPLLIAGSEEFNLVADRPPQRLHIPDPPASRLKAYFGEDLAVIIEELRSNENYCPGGKLRPELAETLRSSLKEKLPKYDEGREWIREQLGV